jgi:hypothetical protein
MNTEKTYSPLSGYFMIVVILIGLFLGIGGFIASRAPFLSSCASPVLR